MDSLRWQWRLPTGQDVRAQLDVDTGIESVWVEKKLLSRSGRGGKIGGHRAPIPASDREIFISFDVANRACALVVDDCEIPPTSSPPRRTLAPTAGVRPQSVAPPLASASLSPAPAPSPYGDDGSSARVGVIAVLVISLLGSAIGGLAFFKRGGGDNVAPLASEITESATTVNGMVSLRFPKPMTVQFNDDDSGLVVNNLKGGETMFAAGISQKIPYHIGPSEIRGPVVKKLRDHFVGRAGAKGADYTETFHRETTCAGYPGSETEGWLKKTTNQVDWKGDKTGTTSSRAKMWSCAFMKGDYLYVMAYVVIEERVATSEPVLQAMLQSATLQPPTTAH